MFSIKGPRSLASMLGTGKIHFTLYYQDTYTLPKVTMMETG